MLRTFRWFLFLLGAICVASSTPAFAQDAKWESVMEDIDPATHSVAGQWSKDGASLNVRAAQGARLVLPFKPVAEYDLRIRFTRRTGQHSVGLVVVHGGRQIAFEVDAWGMNLAGFQNIGGESIQNNATRKNNVRLRNNRKYTLTVEVRKDQLRALLDDKEIARFRSDGHDLSLPDLWQLPDPQTCGLLAWDCDTTFHAVEVRATGDASTMLVNSSAKGKTGNAAGPPGLADSAASKKGRDEAASKRVLIIIANYHFFYREYADPRAELERAGIRVSVAAGRKAGCQPHSGSGEGGNGGIVMPDIALSDVKVSDYDAVLFSGGWGASMYQFAFRGRYNDPAYNGNHEIKQEANRIVNEFLAAKKYVCALCNATSVLAWARVDGTSPLAGKQVCAPTRQAPPGTYNGRAAQPSCRWHAEMNGARLSPPGIIGQPGTAFDDVIVDGLIITGEDDISARQMGRKMVEVLMMR